MQIGDLKLANPVVTAPMAGVTDLPFRLLLKEQGCGLVCGEMVSAQALVYGNRNTLKLLTTDPRERPVSIQLFGSDPETMARAAEILATYPVDLIDINMGCPVPKVVKNGEGAALLTDLPRAARIVRAVVAAVDCPGDRENAAGLGARCGGRPRAGRALRRSGGGRRCGPRTLSRPVLQWSGRLGCDQKGESGCRDSGDRKRGHLQRRRRATDADRDRV